MKPNLITSSLLLFLSVGNKHANGVKSGRHRHRPKVSTIPIELRKGSGLSGGHAEHQQLTQEQVNIIKKLNEEMGVLKAKCKSELKNSKNTNSSNKNPPSCQALKSNKKQLHKLSGDATKKGKKSKKHKAHQKNQKKKKKKRERHKNKIHPVHPCFNKFDEELEQCKQNLEKMAELKSKCKENGKASQFCKEFHILHQKVNSETVHKIKVREPVSVSSEISVPEHSEKFDIPIEDPFEASTTIDPPVDYTIWYGTTQPGIISETGQALYSIDSNGQAQTTQYTQNTPTIQIYPLEYQFPCQLMTNDADLISCEDDFHELWALKQICLNADENYAEEVAVTCDKFHFLKERLYDFYNDDLIEFLEEQKREGGNLLVRFGGWLKIIDHMGSLRFDIFHGIIGISTNTTLKV